jgi:hypothetical protein
MVIVVDFLFLFFFIGLIPCVWSWEAWKEKEARTSRIEFSSFRGNNQATTIEAQNTI